MRPCPRCHQDIKRRKDDACPNCGQAISLYRGHYYRAEDGAPNMAIIARFEELVSKQLSKLQNTSIPFRLNRKSSAFRIELVVAERILESCEFDLDLALRTLTELFTNQLWSWKSRTSLRQIMTDLPGALAIARVAAQMEMARYARELALGDQLAMKEDIFK